MNEFTAVTLVGQRVEDVFAVIQDVARTPVWSPGLCEAPDKRSSPETGRRGIIGSRGET